MLTHRSHRKTIIHLLAAFIVFSITTFLPHSAFAQELTLSPNPEAEQYILDRVPTWGGYYIDLTEEFPQEEDRVISAEFLQNLLAGELAKIPRQGVALIGVVVSEDIDMRYMDAPFELRLEDSSFKGGVDISSSHFASVIFDGSVFQKDVYFQRLTVDTDLFLRDAQLKGYADFSGSRFLSASFDQTVFEQEAYFQRMNVETELSFLEAEFKGVADFYQSSYGTLVLNAASLHGNASFFEMEVKSDFLLVDTRFENTAEDAYIDFSRLKIGNDVDATGAYLASPGGFNDSQVSGNLVLDGVQVDQDLDISGARVGGLFVCSNAIFNGEVYAVALIVDSQIQCWDAQFNSADPEKNIVFRKIQTGAAFFERVKFAGKVDFSFSAFEDRTRFNDTVFMGPVDFTSAQFKGGDVQFKNTQFQYPDSPANFTRIEVEEPMLFEKATFLAGLDLSYTNLKDLFIYGDPEVPMEINTLILERAVINRELKLAGLNIQSLQANALHVSGPAIIGTVAVADTIDLQDASFETLSISTPGFEWPKNPGAFQLRGMTYKNIDMGGHGLTKETSQSLLELVNQSAYSPQAYKALQQFLNDKGHPDWAGEVELAMKIRERRDGLAPLSAAWFWSWFLYIFAGYGQMPYLAFIWSAMVVVVGSFVYYREDNMLSLQRDEARVVYNPLWYSFALFIPYINLDITGKWDPHPKRKWAYYYKYFHQMLGWVLMPIALLTFSGII